MRMGAFVLLAGTVNIPVVALFGVGGGMIVHGFNVLTAWGR